MTSVAISRPHRLLSALAEGSSYRSSHQRRHSRTPLSRTGPTPAAIKTGQHGQIPAACEGTRVLSSPPGVIGAAVVKAARRSAGLSLRNLARLIGVSPMTVRTWENGACPLYAVRYDQLSRAAGVLRQAGALVGQDVGELVVAGQCDLLITGMLLGFEDYAEVPPVDHGATGTAARGLLRWALTGQAPERYRAYAGPGTLLAAQDVASFVAIAQDLREGLHGTDLASYGTALIALAKG